MSNYFNAFIMVIFCASALAGKDDPKPLAKPQATLFEMSDDDLEDAEEELDDNADQELVVMSEQLRQTNVLAFAQLAARPLPAHLISESSSEDESDVIQAPLHYAVFVAVILLGAICNQAF